MHGATIKTICQILINICTGNYVHNNGGGSTYIQDSSVVYIILSRYSD